LKCLASSKLSILFKSLFLCFLVIRSSIRFRDIQKVDVVARSILIPPKYRIDRRAELDRILLIDTAGIYPEVLQSVDCSLLRVELYFLPPSLTLTYAGFCFLQANLLLSPSIREYYVRGDVAAGSFAKDDLAVRSTLQEAYKNHR
jgi:hypothetical protein